LSYAYTLRDWADKLDDHYETLRMVSGEKDLRAFKLFLRGTYYFLRRNRIQAYHLVAGREPAALWD
jgi:cyclopropane fatty-acyl-phospholipid synthase-like methyltransferase